MNNKDYQIRFFTENAHNYTHFHPEVEFLYVMQGTVTVYLLDKTYTGEDFGYFGAFSGGNANPDVLDLDNDGVRSAVFMLGSGEEDMAYNESDIGTPVYMRALDDAGISYDSYFVTGAHDWQAWPRMFTYFADEVLWTK